MNKNKIKELFNSKKARIIAASVLAGVIALGAVGYIIGMADVKVSADSKKEVEEKVVLAEKETEVSDLKDKLNDENISDEEKKEIETKIAEKEVAIKEEENSTSNNKQTENNSNNTDNTVAVSTPKEPTEKPSKPNNNNNNNAHTHSWVEQFQTINHQEQGHYEDVLVSAAWSEQKPVYEDRWSAVCNGCKADITADPGAHMKEQMLAGILSCGSWADKLIQIQVGTETINHEAVYDKKYVVDKAAWTENKLTGYKCSSCGSTK